MELPDVNVLVYAFRKDAPDHSRYRGWLEALVNADRPFGMSSLVLSGFLRVVTHPKVFTPPTPIEAALGFVDVIKTAPMCVPIEPGARHWDIFAGLCRDARARGNIISDAYLAAVAIESGSLWITTDRDFSRFSGLTWRHPLRPSP